MTTMQNITNTFFNKIQNIKNDLYETYYNPEDPNISYIIGLKFNRIPKSGYYFLNKLSNEGIFIKYAEYNYVFINYLHPNKQIELDNIIKKLHYHFIISLELFDIYIKLVIENIDITQLNELQFNKKYNILIMKYNNKEKLTYSYNTLNNIIEPPPGLDIYTMPKSNISSPPGLTIESSSRSVLIILEIINDKQYKCNLFNSSYSENYYKITISPIIKNMCKNCYKIINNIVIQKINY